jgi:flagellar M-ring protein FliF
MMMRLAETALLALVALVAILLLGRPVVSRLTASLAPAAALAAGESTRGAAGAAPALPGASAEAGLGQEEMVSLAHIEGQLRASSIQRLTDMVGRHPEESLAVVRRWLTPEEAA